MHRHFPTRPIAVLLVCLIVVTTFVIAQTSSPQNAPLRPVQTPSPQASPTPKSPFMPVAPPAGSIPKWTRNLTQYTTAAPITIPDNVSPAARRSAMGDLRAFIAEQWQGKKRARISYVSTLIQGLAPGSTTFYVEPDEAGKWRVALEIQGQDYPQYFYAVEQVSLDQEGFPIMGEDGEGRKAVGTALMLKESRESNSGLIL